jgi:sugar O-acyltransferase (sialic acid O-acetyltransferase NeuD family)
MSQPVIVLGGGGHAKVLIHTLQLLSIKILGVCAPSREKVRTELSSYWIGDDEVINNYPIDSIWLVNGLGTIGCTKNRRDLFQKFKELGYHFASVIHPSAIIADDVTLAEGVQIMAGSVIQPGSKIGSNTIINTKTSVDHDCVIGNHTHLAPGVTICGEVHIGDEVHIGTGANVIQGIKIGSNCLVGAGSLIIKNIRDGLKVAGVPAKEMRS